MHCQQKCKIRLTGWFRGKQSACNVGDLSLIPGSGRSAGGEMAMHSSILAWRILIDRGAWRATVQSTGLQRVGHDWATSLSLSFRIDRFDILAVQGTLKESSPAPQFESINSSALSFLCGSILISIHDYWENHSLVYMYLIYVVHWRRQWKTSPEFFLWEPNEQYKEAKRCDPGRWDPPKSIAPFATGEDWRNSSRKNEEAGCGCIWWWK